MNRMLLLCLILLIFKAEGKSLTPNFTTDFTPCRVLTDTIDPVIFCPGSQIVNLAPLRCDTILNYTVNAFDDQGQYILILLDGIPSGGAFPSGATVNTWLATDLSGNTATCSFTVTTFEPLTQPVCDDLTTVLLDQNCSYRLNPFEVLEGGPYGCPLHFIAEVDKTLPFGNGPWLDVNFGVADINQNYQVRITSLLTNARCFGTVQVRDSLPPIVSCQDINVPCALPLEQLTPAFLRDSFGMSIAAPIANDACSGGSLSISFSDVLQNLPCDDTTVVSGIIRRTWSATDNNGNIGTCEQIIRRHRVLGNVQIPGNKTTICANPDLTEATNGVPYIQFINRRYDITPNSYCEFDLQTFDTIQAGNCGGNYTIRRTWKIYDACLPLSGTNPKIGVQNIVVVDQTGPAIHCPANMIITVADNNCRGSVDLPDVFISDNCSALSTLQAFWTDSSLSKMMTGSIQYDVDSTGTDTLGVFGIVASFPIGTTTLLYVANDSCGNTSDCSFQLTVANMNAPVVKCDSLLLVGLPTNGYLSLPAAVLDNGSTDDCSPLVFKAKLAETNTCHLEALLTDTLHICCHNSGDTLAGTLRVYDVAVPAGAVSNTYGAGHFTDCAFKVRVSGTNAPSCTAPANITISCEAFDPTLDSYGGLLAQSCAVDSIALTESLNNFDTLCSRGTITRLFRVFSNNGLMGQCSQKIVVDYEQDYFIRFPNDVIVTVCDTLNLYGTPTFFGKDCELIDPMFEDERFTVVPDACVKIERTWKIVNWCTFDPDLPIITVPNPNPNPVTNHPDNLVGPVLSNNQTNGDPWKSTVVKINPTDGQPTNYSVYFDPNANGYQYKQIIKIIDTQKPVVENCPAAPLMVPDVTQNDPLLWNAPYWFDPLLVAFDLCEAPTEVTITAQDACSGGELNFEYQLFLDLNSDGVRETMVSSTSFPPSNTVYYNNVSGVGESRQFDFRPVPADQKWRFALEEVVSGSKKTASVKFNSINTPNTFVTPQLPYGNHKIKWFVTDACGNESTCEYQFNVRDTKPPTVICQPNFSVNLIINATIQLWATDFLQYSEDNCTPTPYLNYAVRKAGTGTGFPTDGNGNPATSIIYGCDGLGVQTVEMWCRDKMDNAGFCLSTVTVQNNNSADCGDPGPSVFGQIRTELADGVEEVQIKMDVTDSFHPDYSVSDVTDNLGRFSFTNGVASFATVTITPTYDVNPLNGLTTFDLVLISKHILGISALNSPYKLIAADANNSKTITTSDIVELRKLLLGIYQVLPNNKSWRFVPTAYVFPDTLNPFQPAFPETIVKTGVIYNQTDQDFIGIKIGDVNNTALANNAASPDDRNAGTLPIVVSSNGKEAFKPGEVVEVTFTSAIPVLGYQFTLNLNGLEVLEIQPGANMTLDHFGLFPDKNALTVVWEKGGIATFTLKCRALEAGNLREMFSISSRITQAEAYQEQANQLVNRFDLALQFPDMGTFELFQNHPNPFAGATDITFNLPEASEATLKVFDVDGRTLFTQSAHYERGTHTINLEKSALDAVGVLYYQLETPRHSGMRKMVKIF